MMSLLQGTAEDHIQQRKPSRRSYEELEWENKGNISDDYDSLVNYLRVAWH